MDASLRSGALVRDMNNLLQVMAGNLAFIAKGTLDAKSSGHLNLARLGRERCTALARRTLGPESEVPAKRIALEVNPIGFENAIINLLNNVSQAMVGHFDWPLRCGWRSRCFP